MVAPSEHLDRSKYVLDFDEQFASATLDKSRWLPYYLPQWSSRAGSLARYRIADEQLRLRIDRDQQPWSRALDGEMRVSNLQTGVRSGPVGSLDGQHRFSPTVAVREEQPERRLYLPELGLVEARAKGNDDPHCMVALWLIGFESTPEESAEVCVFEIFGNEVSETESLVGMGIHPHNDPRVRDEFTKVAVADVLDFHTYSAERLPDGVNFYIDDQLVLSTEQSPTYSMQLMLDIYEFPDVGARDGAYPKEFVVDWVRGWNAAPTGPASPTRVS